MSLDIGNYPRLKPIHLRTSHAENFKLALTKQCHNKQRSPQNDVNFVS